MTEEQFLLAIRAAFAEYGYASGELLKFGSSDKLTYGELKMILLGQFMEIIEYYFRPTTSGDTNFFEPEEIEDVISHANRIMGTTLHVDLS
jgi:hypothetical protein